MKTWQISRRTMLRGLGAAVALPMLDAMAPLQGFAGAAARASGAAPGAAPAGAGGAPLRMAFVAVPNGVILSDWHPSTAGANFELPPTLKALEKVRKELLVFGNFTHDNANAKGDGPGDHARASACFLTGAHPFKTAGANIRNGVSVDQVAARAVGERTRLPSLEIGCDPGRAAGNCDSGYSCAYSSNISWRSETQPVPKEVDPAKVFDRLFGRDADSGDVAKRSRYRRSVLDAVAEDARAMRRNLGTADGRKLDEFATSVREIEKRIERAPVFAPAAPPAGVARPGGIPGTREEHIRLMYDLLLLAFQTDQTRIATYLLAPEGDNRGFPSLGVKEGHHSLSHHSNDGRKIEQIKKIDRFYVGEFARFVRRMSETREGEGTLLDHSMILYGSGLGDGNKHRKEDLPVLLAGRANGTVHPGRYVRAGGATPLCNLYVSMLQRMGVPADRFGDSNGVMAGLTV